MKDRFKLAADQTLANLKKEFNQTLVGLIATGSAVTDNTLPKSDLDLFCVLSGVKRKVRVFDCAGVKVKLTIRPLQTIRESFLDTNLPDILHMFATAQILFDPHGAVRDLVNLAKKIWEAGRPATPLISPNKERLRLIPYAFLDDAQDLLTQDADASVYLMNCTLEASLDVAFRLARQWYKHPKTRIQDLDTFNPSLAKKVRGFLKAEMPKDKLLKLTEIVDDIIKPLGGRLETWESPWEMRTIEQTWEPTESALEQGLPKEDEA